MDSLHKEYSIYYDEVHSLSNPLMYKTMNK
jgi:hypothetical protein